MLSLLLSDSVKVCCSLWVSSDELQQRAAEARLLPGLCLGPAPATTTLEAGQWVLCPEGPSRFSGCGSLRINLWAARILFTHSLPLLSSEICHCLLPRNYKKGFLCKTFYRKPCDIKIIWSNAPIMQSEVRHYSEWYSFHMPCSFRGVCK